MDLARRFSIARLLEDPSRILAIRPKPSIAQRRGHHRGSLNTARVLLRWSASRPLSHELVVTRWLWFPHVHQKTRSRAGRVALKHESAIVNLNRVMSASRRIADTTAAAWGLNQASRLSHIEDQLKLSARKATPREKSRERRPGSIDRLQTACPIVQASRTPWRTTPSIAKTEHPKWSAEMA